MANKTRKVEQKRNVCHVVQTFCGVPCAVETFPDEKAALRRYEEMKTIMLDVRRNEKVETDEKVNEKTRGCKTSCGGLPWFTLKRDTVTETLSVVRGPEFEYKTNTKTKPDMTPYVAVCMDGELQVTLFEKYEDAKRIYDSIRKQHADSQTFEEHDDPFRKLKKSFSVDEDEGPSVMIDLAPTVKEGQECQIV